MHSRAGEWINAMASHDTAGEMLYSRLLWGSFIASYGERVKQLTLPSVCSYFWQTC